MLTPPAFRGVGAGMRGGGGGGGGDKKRKTFSFPADLLLFVSWPRALYTYLNTDP